MAFLGPTPLRWVTQIPALTPAGWGKSTRSRSSCGPRTRPSGGRKLATPRPNSSRPVGENRPRRVVKKPSRGRSWERFATGRIVLRWMARWSWHNTPKSSKIGDQTNNKNQPALYSTLQHYAAPTPEDHSSLWQTKSELRPAHRWETRSGSRGPHRWDAHSPTRANNGQLLKKAKTTPLKGALLRSPYFCFLSFLLRNPDSSEVILYLPFQLLQRSVLCTERSRNLQRSVTFGIFRRRTRHHEIMKSELLFPTESIGKLRQHQR